MNGQKRGVSCTKSTFHADGGFCQGQSVDVVGCGWEEAKILQIYLYRLILYPCVLSYQLSSAKKKINCNLSCKHVKPL